MLSSVDFIDKLLLAQTTLRLLEAPFHSLTRLPIAFGTQTCSKRSRCFGTFCAFAPAECQDRLVSPASLIESALPNIYYSLILNNFW
jgi:hypothetical protein